MKGLKGKNSGIFRKRVNAGVWATEVPQWGTGAKPPVSRGY